MDRFDRELAKELIKRLPQNTVNEWSRIIEGLIERRETTVPHDYVAIIIDSEVDEKEYRSLSKRLIQFITKNEYFKRSHYRILLWKQDEISFVYSKIKFNVACAKKHLEEIEVDSGTTVGWDAFWELYKPHRKAGQVIMITTAEKVAVLEQSKARLIKNLVIIYQGSSETKTKEVIKSIPCISLSVSEVE